MNVSMDSGLNKTASAYKRVKDSTAEAIFKTKKKKKNGKSDESIGMGLPNQLSREEQQKVDNLKNQAMQIASKAEGGLTPVEAAQIKGIEKEIGKITGMPMHEGLTYKTKKIAESNALEKQKQINAEKNFMEQEAKSDMAGKTGLVNDPGMQMLQQKSLVTNIKLLNAGSSNFMGAS